MNMQFIIEWTAKQKVSWLYMPMVYTDMAETFLVEKNYAQAISYAGKALNIKPDHADAFVILVDSYAAVGNKIKALDETIEGLKHVPAVERTEAPIHSTWWETALSDTFQGDFGNRGCCYGQGWRGVCRSRSCSRTSIRPSGSVGGCHQISKSADNGY